MAEMHVIGALRHKRAELAGMLRQLEQHLVQQRANLAHVDATMRLFDPDIRPKDIRPKQLRERNAWFRQGECLRLIGLNLYGAFGVKRFSLSSAHFSILFRFLCSAGEPFLCPDLHPGSEPRGAAVNIAVGTAGGGAKRC
jgi:hypothetical protein